MGILTKRMTIAVVTYSTTRYPVSSSTKLNLNIFIDSKLDEISAKVDNIVREAKNMGKITNKAFMKSVMDNEEKVELEDNDPEVAESKLEKLEKFANLSTTAGNYTDISVSNLTKSDNRCHQFSYYTVDCPIGSILILDRCINIKDKVVIKSPFCQDALNNFYLMNNQERFIASVKCKFEFPCDPKQQNLESIKRPSNLKCPLNFLYNHVSNTCISLGSSHYDLNPQFFETEKPLTNFSRFISTNDVCPKSFQLNIDNSSCVNQSKQTKKKNDENAYISKINFSAETKISQLDRAIIKMLYNLSFE